MQLLHLITQAQTQRYVNIPQKNFIARIAKSLARKQQLVMYPNLKNVIVFLLKF